MYGEVPLSDSTVVLGWREVNFATTGVDSSSSSSLAFGSGYSILHGNEVVGTDRWLSWRVIGCTLELMDVSLLVDVERKGLRMNFSSSIVPKVAFIEREDSLHVLVVTTRRIHCITFDLPLMSGRDPSSSVIDSFERSLHHAQLDLADMIHGVPQVIDAASNGALLIGSSQGVYAVRALSRDSSLWTAEPLRITSVVQRLWSGFTSTLSSGARPEEDVLALASVELSDSSYVVTLNAKYTLQVWDLSSGECVISEEIIADAWSNVEEAIITRSLIRTSPMRRDGCCYVVLGLGLQGETQFQVFLLQSPEDGHGTPLLHPGGMRYAPDKELLDFQLILMEQDEAVEHKDATMMEDGAGGEEEANGLSIWALWRRGSRTVVRCATLPSLASPHARGPRYEKGMPPIESNAWSDVVPHNAQHELEHTMTYHMDASPEEIRYEALSRIARARIDTTIMNEAVRLFSGREFTDTSPLNWPMMEERLVGVVEEEASQEEYHSAWSRMLECCAMAYNTLGMCLGLYTHSSCPRAPVVLVTRRGISLLHALPSNTPISPSSSISSSYVLNDGAADGAREALICAAERLRDGLPSEAHSMLYTRLCQQHDPDEAVAELFGEFPVPVSVDEEVDGAWNSCGGWMGAMNVISDILSTQRAVEESSSSILLHAVQHKAKKSDCGMPRVWLAALEGAIAHTARECYNAMRDLTLLLVHRTHKSPAPDPTPLKLLFSALHRTHVLTWLCSTHSLHRHRQEEEQKEESSLMMRVDEESSLLGALLPLLAPSLSLEQQASLGSACVALHAACTAYDDGGATFALVSLLLLRAGQPEGVDAMIELLGVWHHGGAHPYVRGCALMAMERPQDAFTHFSQAALDVLEPYAHVLGIHHGSSDVAAFTTTAGNGGGGGRLMMGFPVAYHLHVARTYEHAGHRALALRAARLALSRVEHRRGAVSAPALAVFRHAVALKRWDEAYHAVTRLLPMSGDPALVDDVLRRLVAALLVCGPSGRQTLVQLPFAPRMEERIHGILLTRARTQEIDPKGRPYRLVYAYLVSRGRYRAAAMAMHESASRCAQEGPMSPTILRTRAAALRATMHAMRLLPPTDAWFATRLHQTHSKHHLHGKRKRPRGPNAYQAGRAGEGEEGEEPSMTLVTSTATSSSAILRHSIPRVVRVEDVEKEYAIASAVEALEATKRKKAAHDEPRAPQTPTHSLAPEQQTTKNSTLLNVIGVQTMEAEKLLPQLVRHRLLQPALSLARTCELDASPVFSAMARKCVETAQRTSHSGYHRSTSAERGWKQLKDALEQYDYTKDTSGGYRAYLLACAEAIVRCDSRVRLPSWLSRSMLELHTSRLVHLYINHGRLHTALNYAKQLLDPHMVQHLKVPISYAYIDQLVDVCEKEFEKDADPSNPYDEKIRVAYEEFRGMLERHVDVATQEE